MSVALLTMSLLHMYNNYYNNKLFMNLCIESYPKGIIPECVIPTP